MLRRGGRALSWRVTLRRPLLTGAVDAFAVAGRCGDFVLHTECSPAPVRTRSSWATRCKRLNVARPLELLRTKANIFHFQEPGKGHLSAECKIFLQLSSRPTEAVCFCFFFQSSPSTCLLILEGGQGRGRERETSACCL